MPHQKNTSQIFKLSTDVVSLWLVLGFLTNDCGVSTTGYSFFRDQPTETVGRPSFSTSQSPCKYRRISRHTEHPVIQQIVVLARCIQGSINQGDLFEGTEASECSDEGHGPWAWAALD